MCLKVFSSIRIPFLIWLISRVAVHLSFAVTGAFVPGIGIREAILRWDGGWYFSIIVDGYSSLEPTGQSNIAFFPGLPLVVRLIAWVPVISTFQASVIALGVFGLFAVIMFWKIAEELKIDHDFRLTATLLFALTPGSVVLSMLYSEGLFITLAALTLLLVLRDKFLLASVFASLSGLVRPTGVVLIAVVFIAVLFNFWKTKKTRTLLSLLIAPLGLVSYALYLDRHVGSPMAYLETQKNGWGEKFSFAARIEDLRQLLDWIVGGFGAADWNRVVPGMLVILAVIAFVGCVKMKLPAGILIYTAGIILMSFFSETLGLRPRFFMTAFPLYLGMTYFFKTQTSRSAAVVLSTSALASYSMVVSGLLLQTP